MTGNGHPARQPGKERAASVAALYPFLGAAQEADDPSGVSTGVLADVVASTRAKVAEVRGLRERVCARDGARLVVAAQRMAAAFAAGGRLLAFGNGGSATDAVGLATLFLHPTPPAPALPALALPADIATVTGLANDIGFEGACARQLAATARPGDIAVGFSTSGNSPNLCAAFHEAARRGLVTVGFAGSDGGAMAESAAIEHLFVAPSDSVHRVQEVQTTVSHVLWESTVAALASMSGAA